MENEDIIGEIYNKGYWKILIVDSDNFVHLMIKEIMKDFKFEDKPFKFMHAYSSVEALDILSKNKDIALILLDIFIKSKNVGLELTRYIREVINNSATRIVLMTSDNSNIQEDAMLNYDINGYESKNELLSKKLNTIVVSALRSYRDILHINSNKQAMEQVVASSATLYEKDSIEDFISSTLWHFNSIIHSCKDNMYCGISGLAALRNFNKKCFNIISAYGKYSGNNNKRIMDSVSQEDFMLIKKAYRIKDHIMTDDRYISYYDSSCGIEAVIFIEIDGKAEHLDMELLDVFHKYVSAAFETLCLNREIEETQREILYLLGEVTEARSEETGKHVQRVSKYSKILAEKYGLLKRDIMHITMAAPIHDVGKIGISDNILMKPGKLTPEEFEIVKTHTTIGYNLLKSSNRELLKSAAIIAHEHHERYDGKGYPRGLKGEGIHIFGRIVAIADVFDALGSPRVYKKAWVINDILNYFREEKGKHFDPDLVDILFGNLDEFIEIKEKYSDGTESQIMNYEL